MPDLTHEQLANSPEAWLLVLLRSLRQGDLLTAADAQERLRDIGIGVEFEGLWPVKAVDVLDE